MRLGINYVILANHLISLITSSTMDSFFSCPMMFVSCNKNTTGITNGAGTANPSGAPEFTPCFSEVGVPQSLVFSVVFCRSLFVHLFFFLSFGHCVVCPHGF